ncbi:Type IV secretory system Conjugative DNA transfer [Labrenzia sp. THAF82]|uniref:type IV secretory system conjugative DNA transfer family protein n=1 Tax=Labrenzia sp. THAF82 TaxID=2587861 RepID=UPI001267F8A4|nr:type IV secretory system conjugative DNA transfer family protein [Labrenzia sp. THAF82]QFT28867.1 Type IV secretory system Conjugative DNA transfer [Labrenzia sp. THAF82]
MDADYAAHRYGRARFADDDMIFDAGLDRSLGVYLGETDSGVHCYAPGQSAALIAAGARGGKGSSILPSLLDGFGDSHVISMDWKGQNGPITGLQPGTHIINWAPRAGGDRINPIPQLTNNSPTLQPDTKLWVQSWIVKNGSKDGEVFQAYAQRITEACALSYIEQYGLLELPGLSDVMALVGTNTETWLEFESYMHMSRFGAVQAMAEELREIRNSDTPNAGGFGGAKTEITNSFACLSDPELRESVSPPFDFDPTQLTEENGPRFQVNLMEAMEFSKSSAPIVRSIYSSIMLLKRRALRSRPQVWLLDEIGNIGAWPLAVELATYGPGYGIRPVYVVQSIQQLDNLAPNASKIIPSSCGTQIYKATRELSEAKQLSSMLGQFTLPVEDFALNERARIAQNEALDAMIFDGADPFRTGTAMAYQDALTEHPKLMPRALMTPDEILNTMPAEMVLVFMPRVVLAPMRLWVRNYWERPDLCGRYLGDPFHDEPGTVSIAGRFRRTRKAEIVTEPVPDAFNDYPQYRRSGTWSFVRGHRPKI